MTVIDWLLKRSAVLVSVGLVAVGVMAVLYIGAPITSGGSSPSVFGAGAAMAVAALPTQSPFTAQNASRWLTTVKRHSDIPVIKRAS